MGQLSGTSLVKNVSEKQKVISVLCLVSDLILWEEGHGVFV